MQHFDPVTWGWGLLGAGLTIFTFILSMLIRKPPSAGSTAIGLLFSLGLMIVGGYFLFQSWSVPVLSVLPKETQKQTPLDPETSLEKVFPPQTAIEVRPSLGLTNASFTLSNWVSWGAKSIHVSSWIKEGAAFARLGTHNYAYLGTGDSVSFTEQVNSTARAIIALCISYELNSHHVEVLHFFSNLDGGGYRRLRDSVANVDSLRPLCGSMPRSAEAVL